MFGACFASGVSCVLIRISLLSPSLSVVTSAVDVRLPSRLVTFSCGMPCCEAFVFRCLGFVFIFLMLAVIRWTGFGLRFVGGLLVGFDAI